MGRLFKRSAGVICHALVLAMLAPSFVLAQGVRGTIVGQVTDQNGGAVAGATVKLVNVAMKVEVRTVQTGEDGKYQLLELEPAVYDLVVSSSGFAERRLSNVKVEPNRNLSLDISLGAAGTAEQINVTASQELLDKQSPTLGTTVDHRRVEGLPLNGRNVLNLALLQPGVTGTSTGFGEGAGIRVNGQRGVENNLTLDGSNNNEVAVGGPTGANPRPDAVEEFRLLTSNFEAEYGRNTGSVINIVTRSGGNEYHGNARFFYRPTFLSAARFFDQNSPSDLPVRGTDDFRRRFERKEIGGNVGGPFKIPRIYNGSQRTFFFVDYERRAQLIGDTRDITGIPTLAERLGDFSGLGRTLLDPSTGLPFAGNRIPQARFSPIAQYYLNFLPAADASGQASAGADQITNNHYFTTRVDHQINPNQVLNFTLNVFDGTVDNPFPFGGVAPNDSSVPGFGGIDKDRTYNYVVRHNYAITPTLINSLLVGYARNNFPSVQPQNGTTPAEIGFTGNFVVEPALAGPPLVWFFDRNFSVGNAIQGPQSRVTENFQIQDSVSWARGDHRFKFGFDGTQYRHDQAFLFVNQGIIGFTRLTGGNTTGDDFADFLIGNSPGFIQTGSNGNRDFRQKAAAIFGQDTWRLSEGLTLSLGVRWEYTSPLTDKFNRVSYYRPGATSQLLTSGQLRNFEGTPVVVPPGGRAPNGVVFVGDPDPVLGGIVPAGGVRKDKNNWAPRIGVAYSPKSSGGLMARLLGDRETVFRAGFGVFYGAIIGDTVLQQLSAPGFSGTDFFAIGGGAGTLADPFAPDPFPTFRGNGGQLPNPFTRSQLELSAPVSFTSQPIDPLIRTPYTLQWNATVERGFKSNYIVTLSYVGNVGRKLYAAEELNPSLGTFFPAPPGRVIPTPEPGNQNDRRSNNDVQESVAQLVSAANSSYNALQANVQKRFDNGLLFQVAYTYSKSINETDTQRGLLDLIDRRFGRGLSADDIPHRFVASWIYDIPFARKLGGPIGKALDGWQIGGIAVFQSGTPITVLNLFDTIGTGGALRSFADLGEPFERIDPRKNDGRAFNPGAFVAFGDPEQGFDLATDFRRGTSGRNQVRINNGVNNWDLVLTKKTRLWTESKLLELRFEAFNAFNHTQFTTVDTNLDRIVRGGDGQIDPTRSTFGKFTGARESRVLQLGVRFSF
jgi:outer membrane receptor protein involved in Fe transport